MQTLFPGKNNNTCTLEGCPIIKTSMLSIKVPADVMSCGGHKTSPLHPSLSSTSLSQPKFYFFSSSQSLGPFEDFLTPVQLNLDMLCFCKQCKSRSVLKKPNDLDLQCLPFGMQICINSLDQAI